MRVPQADSEPRDGDGGVGCRGIGLDIHLQSYLTLPAEKHTPQIGLGTVTWDPASLLHDRALWLFSLAVLLLVFLYCFGRLTRTHQPPVVLSAAVFSFLEVSLITVFLVGVAALSSPQAPDRLKVFLLLAFLAGTYAGDFWFFAGFAGGFWLDRRKQRIRSTRRLLLESAAVGALLGALFPLYYLATSTMRAMPPSLLLPACCVRRSVLHASLRPHFAIV